MNTTVDYLKKNEIPKNDWNIYLQTDGESEESTEGMERHWVDKADEQQSNQFLLLQEFLLLL